MSDGRPKIMNAGTNYLKASEVISKLADLILKHGDRPVAYTNFDVDGLGYPDTVQLEGDLFILDGR